MARHVLSDQKREGGTILAGTPAALAGSETTQAVAAIATLIHLGFPPVAGPRSRVLILGSLPGAESLRQQRYYAKKANLFWAIMDRLVGAAPDLPYPQRLRRLSAAGIGLWDVCARAARIGSLDSNIEATSIVPNDFAGFFAAHPTIAVIAFNGRAAEKIYADRVLPTLAPPWQAIPRLTLPSTSPAYAAMRPDEKGRRWSAALQPHVGVSPLRAGGIHPSIGP